MFRDEKNVSHFFWTNTRTSHRCQVAYKLVSSWFSAQRLHANHEMTYKITVIFVIFGQLFYTFDFVIG